MLKKVRRLLKVSGQTAVIEGVFFINTKLTLLMQEVFCIYLQSNMQKMHARGQNVLNLLVEAV
jgi:hypothetical protein